MAGRTQDFSEFIGTPDALANAIANRFLDYEKYRRSWVEEKKELRNYLFATDTTRTTNATLPWKNSTTTPKLTQLRDNLHANYMAALFPNDEWLLWEGDDEDAEAEEKRKVISSYIMNKLRTSNFVNTVSAMVYDYIDYGNVFATSEYVNETQIDEDTGEVMPGYVGPKAIRISPYDILINPTAQSIEYSPKLIRTIKSLGELAADIQDHPEAGYLNKVFDEIVNTRRNFQGMSATDFHKSEGYEIDGFSNIVDYYNSGYVEILELHGDIYDIQTEELLKNRIITIVDRQRVIRNVRNPSWRGNSIRHAGWRLRPDNLYAMGPLDNLVGMQYRIDHLENLKADVFDLIAHPVMKVKGFVEDFNYGPGEKVFVGEDGDVDMIRPDTTALNADMQIQVLENKMEEMAGAPRQAMGIRTPGEKTAFEVQTLDNAASRVFQNKVAYFERNFLEPLLNDMLELARRNMEISDVVRVVDDEFGAALFETITPEDLAARGKIRPVGARHFAAKANQFQNLLNLLNSAVGQDPAVNVHISGIKLATVVEELLNIEKFNLVQPNIRIAEQLDTQRMMNAGQQTLNQEEAISEEGIEAEENTEEMAMQQQIS
tara:strand:- start:4013 stop:5818 length:1806 start_codon:yes stop_codon:yes gene_type:complete